MFADRGIRVVSPDRPGCGGFSPRPGRTIRTIGPPRSPPWPTISMSTVHRGGAVGRRALRVRLQGALGERVVGVGAGRRRGRQHGWPAAWDGYDPVDARDHAPRRRARPPVAGGALRREQAARFLSVTSGLVPANAMLLEDRARAETLLATIVESFRQGVGGLAADLTISPSSYPGVTAGPMPWEVVGINEPAAGCTKRPSTSVRRGAGHVTGCFARARCRRRRAIGSPRLLGRSGAAGSRAGRRGGGAAR